MNICKCVQMNICTCKCIFIEYSKKLESSFMKREERMTHTLTVALKNVLKCCVSV